MMNQIVYTTTTPAKPARLHYEAIEFEADTGYRFWESVREDRVAETIERYADIGYGLSDLDHSARCWCLKNGVK